MTKNFLDFMLKKKKIDDGFWEIGQRLPSERDLADDYEVSRMTLRQAIMS